MITFEEIKRAVKILKIDKDSVTIGTEKGYWSKGLEFGNKKGVNKMGKKILGLCGNFMDIEETIYALEKLVEEKFSYTPQCIFIAIKYLRKFRKIEDIVVGDNFKRIH